MARQYNLMSSDGHLEVPPERWVHRVPEKYRDRAPHTVHLPDGGDALMIEGQPLLEANFLDLRAGRAEGTWQPFGLKVADAAGTGATIVNGGSDPMAELVLIQRMAVELAEARGLDPDHPKHLTRSVVPP